MEPTPHPDPLQRSHSLRGPGRGWSFLLVPLSVPSGVFWSLRSQLPVTACGTEPGRGPPRGLLSAAPPTSGTGAACCAVSLSSPGFHEATPQMETGGGVPGPSLQETGDGAGALLWDEESGRGALRGGTPFPLAAWGWCRARGGSAPCSLRAPGRAHVGRAECRFLEGLRASRSGALCPVSHRARCCWPRSPDLPRGGREQETEPTAPALCGASGPPSQPPGSPGPRPGQFPAKRERWLCIGKARDRLLSRSSLVAPASG